jgi:hypothetical protein
MKDCMQRALTKDCANQNKSFRWFEVGDIYGIKKVGKVVYGLNFPPS